MAARVVAGATLLAKFPPEVVSRVLAAVSDDIWGDCLRQGIDPTQPTHEIVTVCYDDERQRFFLITSIMGNIPNPDPGN